MYILQRYSSVLIVFVCYIKTLTGLPFDSQPAPAVQAQLDTVALTASNHPADVIAAEPRSLNVNTSIVVRSQSNPAVPPQQEDVALRNGFDSENLQTPPAAGSRIGSANQNDSQKKINESAEAAPALKSGLADLASNVSSVETRSLNTSSPVSAAATSNAANDTQIAPRSLEFNPNPPPVNTSSSSSYPFIPSFLKSFGLRRGEDDSTSDLSVSSNSEHASPVNNSPHLAQRSGLEQVSPVSNNDNAAATAPQLSFNVAPNDPNVASRLEMVSGHPAASFPFSVPYINVYPVDNVKF